jgi:hypothetical protein
MKTPDFLKNVPSKKLSLCFNSLYKQSSNIMISFSKAALTAALSHVKPASTWNSELHHRRKPAAQCTLFQASVSKC